MPWFTEVNRAFRFIRLLETIPVHGLIPEK